MSVRIANLSKHFGSQKAVDQISFEANKGKILGFLGPNGAGKSTTMKMATGFLIPSSGDVWVEGISVSQEPIKVKRQVGYLPEHNPMYMEMYVHEFLRFIGQSYGLKGRNNKLRVSELIEICGLTLEQHKKIRMLSKGYRQRVGLAKALMGDPNVLILDEPTSGLDPNQLIEIRKVIKDISRQKTVILSTHIMQEVEALCEEVVIINKGQLVANDTLASLRQSVKTKKVKVIFDKGIDQRVFDEVANIEYHQLTETEYEFISTNEDLKNEILSMVSSHKMPLSSIQDAGGSLEEIFHSLTNKEESR
jgi:ABC-2 type transport system ATP-binding protein